jgi:hypothetical protein
MKLIISTILFALVLTTGLFAQHTIINVEHKRILTQVEDSTYDVQFLDEKGNVVQKGQYWRDEDSLKPHGTWTLFAMNSNEAITRSTFNKGEQLSIETIIDGKLVSVDKEQLVARKQASEQHN